MVLCDSGRRRRSGCVVELKYSQHEVHQSCGLGFRNIVKFNGFGANSYKLRIKTQFDNCM